MRAGRIAPTAIALLVATIAFPPPALVVWNTTASLPVGFYVVTRAAPKRGDLLVIRLSPSMQLLAVSRGILSPNTPLLKPVAALVGDRVCRFGTAININGHHAATARLLDLYGRRLPTWQGCQRLSRFEVFILALHPNSFDSRYCGTLPLNRALGVARALLVLPLSTLLTPSRFRRANYHQDKRHDRVHGFRVGKPMGTANFFPTHPRPSNQRKINSSHSSSTISECTITTAGPSSGLMAHARVALYRAANRPRDRAPTSGSRPIRVTIAPADTRLTRLDNHAQSRLRRRTLRVPLAHRTI